MDMNELKNTLPNCPRCGRHCPIDAVSCPRGKELVESILSGEMTIEEALGGPEGAREGHGPREGGRPRHRDMGEFGEGRDEGRHHAHGRMDDAPDRRPAPHDHPDFPPHRHPDGPRGEERGPHGERHGHRPPFAPDDDSLMALFHRCMHMIRHDGPASGQQRVLQLLAEESELPQRELQQRLGIQPGSLSELIGKLENKGLVVQARDDQDKRRATIRLTEQGRAAIAEPDSQQDPFGALTEDEQAQLKSLLRKIMDAAK